MPREWDAARYDRVATPQAHWGEAVLDRLDGRGLHRVMDAGCGSGRVTEQLLERLPGVHVVALDGSRAMLDQARARLARHLDRVRFVHADLGKPLPLDEPVDAILSTATFHWVRDKDALYQHLAAALVPGGRLVAQCGGAGNIAGVIAVLADLDPSVPPMTFEAPEEAAARLRAAGFTAVETWLENRPTTFPDRATFDEFLRAVVLGAYLERRPEAERDGFVRAVSDRLGEPRLDYVRLNIMARLPAAGSPPGDG